MLRAIAAAGSGLSIVTFIPEGNIVLRWEECKNKYRHYDVKLRVLRILEVHPLGDHYDPIEGHCKLITTHPFEMDIASYKSISKLMAAFKAKASEHRTA